MKYKNWLFNWLENYIKLTAKQRTYERYCDLIKTHLIPALGEYEMNDLSEYEMNDLSIDIMQKFVSFLLREGNAKTNSGLRQIQCVIINSNSDMSLMNRLAFWCNGDREQMLRIFATRLYRPDKPQSYYEHTAIKAVKGTPDRFTPSSKQQQKPPAHKSSDGKGGK